MEYLRLALLGVTQGITEFLPISSDGHLVVVDRVFARLSPGETPASDLMTTVLLHLGTLIAILVVFRKRILGLLGEDRRTIGLLIVGSIPAAAVGLLVEKYLEEYLTSPLLTGFMLPVNGLLLLWASRRATGDLSYTRLTHVQAFLIGVAQACAVLPGISRSGTTIGSGMALGLKRDAAATFSFLLAIPVIGGAVALKLAKLIFGEPLQVAAGPLVLGTILSFVVGVAALLLLFRLLAAGQLRYLAYWCIALGIAIATWELVGARGE